TKIATLTATAKVAADAAPDAIIAGIKALDVDPDKYIARSVYDDVAGRLATLTAANKTALVEQGKKEGKLSPAMETDFVPTLSYEQLSAFLKTAPVIVTGAAPAGAAPATVATLSADDKAAAKAAGVTEEAFLAAKKEEVANMARRSAQLSS